MATEILHQSSDKAASFGHQVAAQTRVELLLTLRRGESVLITLIVPVVLLVFFASLNIIPASTGRNPARLGDRSGDSPGAVDW